MRRIAAHVTIPTMLRIVIAIAIVGLLGVAAGTATTASAGVQHRSGCHVEHSCPSDHATYRWGPRRLLCVKPTSDERTAKFKIRVRYGGLTYWCKK